jgi:hypothetical protein
VDRNENRNNGNRLFDSQNNDKGGYACPRPVSSDPLRPDEVMYYYEGSELQIEWTQQHGCGENEFTHCQIVMQYMCEDQNSALRDGTPNNAQDAATDRMNEGDVQNPRFGYHETLASYQRCSTRDRNLGLYTADQRVQGSSAIFTRQNPNGNRNGWECAEESEYYPYWHPAPWKDIAILSSDMDKDGFPSCKWYRENSQNVKSVGHCFDSDPKSEGWMMETATPLRYNQPGTCAAGGGFWYQAPALGGGKPHCGDAPRTRPNVLGSSSDGYIPNYMWKIPKVSHSRSANPDAGTLCVFRIRYNISTMDVPFNLDIGDNNNFDEDRRRGPNTNPSIQPFEPFDSMGAIPHSDMMGAYNLTLRVNTNQYGRTFQDRSYTFYIRSRGSSMVGPGDQPKKGKRIVNLNVRGKRGNIVQTFPAVEYDFVPQVVNIGENQHLHIQWTGSDYNPNRQPNNAEGGPVDEANAGNYRADRSNLVQLMGNHLGGNMPQPRQRSNSIDDFFTVPQAARMAFLNQDPELDCDSWETLLANNGNNADNANLDKRNCYKLNAQRHPYFDGGLIKVKAAVGTYHMFSTRNNNFSNRSQKMTIHVFATGLTSAEIAGIVIGSLSLAGMATAAGGYQYAKRYPNSAVASAYSSFFANPYVQKVTSHPTFVKVFGK